MNDCRRVYATIPLSEIQFKKNLTTFHLPFLIDFSHMHSENYKEQFLHNHNNYIVTHNITQNSTVILSRR